VANGPLMKRLAADGDWAVVHLSGRYVVFVWRKGPAGELARRYAIDPEKLDAAGHVSAVAASDPVEAFALYHGGMLLYRLAWGDKKMAGGDVADPDERMLRRELTWAEHAIELWREAVRRRRDYREANLKLATALGLLGAGRALRMQCCLRRNEPLLADAARRLGCKTRDEAHLACLKMPAYQDHLKQAEFFRLLALESWKEAEDVLRLALARSRRCGAYAEHLESLQEQQAAFRRGVIEVPAIPLR